VADLAGQDKISLVGVQFIPAVTNWGSATANTNETHKLTITISNAFNSPTANTTNAGNYVFAMRAGGEFRAGPTGAASATTCGAAACNTIGNSVTFPGTGTFSPTLANKAILSPSGKNSLPLSFTVAGPTSSIVSFNGTTNTTLGQENPTYPTFVCDDNGSTAGGACKPSITEVMTVTLKGPDSFVLVNGGDGFGASCAATLTATQQKQIAFLTKLVTFLNWWESRHPNPRLSAFIDKIELFLATVNTVDPNCGGATLVNLDIATAAAIDQVAFVADGAVEAEPAPQTGTITIRKNTDQETSDSFTFDISGPSSSTETIPMGGTNSQEIVVTVDAGTYNIIENPLSRWTLNSSSCGGEGPTTNVVVPVDGNVSCTFNNNKTFISADYQVISAPGVTWDAARAAALLLAPAGSWDLATITSAEEQAFIQTLLPSLPISPDTDYWIGGEQPVDSAEPGGNWRWATTGQVFYNDEPIGYANWGSTSTGPANEPNNNFGPDPNENHVTMDSRYGWGWNDLPGGFGTKGYVAERVSP
jgi:hypothetical protein